MQHEDTEWCFNPLHCGAVVASGHRPEPSDESSGFNPLHCGAVVASRPRRTLFPPPCGFNPLHCGAVVASRRRRHGAERAGDVSIPFIAGQWSLQTLDLSSYCKFVQVSIPFIAGQWSLRVPRIRRRARRRGFNPLHCGAVVASIKAFGVLGVLLLMFQSPSLRGSGRFGSKRWLAPRRKPGFNPLHCGAVVASRTTCHFYYGHLCFNPLHCGAVVASRNARVVSRHVAFPFQSPSLRGSGRFEE